MRVFVRGSWYDAEQEFVAIRVSDGEKKQLGAMPGTYYSQYPQAVGEADGKRALDQAVALDAKSVGGLTDGG